MPAPALELSDADRDELTPGELAALMGEPTEEAAAAALAEKTAETIAADRAAETANDAEGDLDEQEEALAGDKRAQTPEEIAAAAAEAAAAAAKAAEQPGEQEPSADDLQALVDADAAPAATAPKPVTYKGITEDAYKAEATKLNAEKASAMKQLMDGEIDAEAYAVIEASVAEKRDDLVASRTLARANEQAAAQDFESRQAEFQGHVAALLKTSKGQAIDYNVDAKAQTQFDQASNMIALDPANANMTPKQVADEANRIVHALRGIALPGAAAAPTPPAAAQAPATKTPALQKNPPPATLSGLPAAAPNATGNDLRSQFQALEGEEAEEFLERLPEATRNALMAGKAV